MSLALGRLPIRVWTALSGTGLALVFLALVFQEANPPWRRYQRAFFRLEQQAADQAVDVAEDEFGRRSDEVHELTARMRTAEQAFQRLQETGVYGRARRDFERAERHLADLLDALQRQRAEYQRVERDFLLAAREADRVQLRTRLEGLRSKADALARDRDRAAAERDEASRRMRAFTAELEAAREMLAKLQAPLARARADRAGIGRRRAEVKQLLIEPLGRVDRCTSCHVAAARPGFGNAAEPLRSHVGRYLQEHPPERFGCTVCHGGQGRATRLPAAHGQVAHWREPLLPGNLVGGRCAVCHRGDDVPGEPYASAGRRLFVEAGCHGCHDVEGLSASPIGPPLGGAGSKLRPRWAAWWLRDPKAYLPRTRMPNFLLTDEEVADISAFLLSLIPSPAPRLTRPSGAVIDAGRSGEALFKESRCITCHAVDARGGTIGPDLGRVASKLHPEWLVEFLRDPARWQPGTRMPRYRFSEREAADLAAYVSSELRDVDEDAWPPVPAVPGRLEDGRRLVQSYGCFGCHQIPGFEATGRVGAELTGYADKEVERLDFGLRLDVPRTWRAWTETKLREPRTFRHGLKMPDYGFSDDERFSLVTYLASLTEVEPPVEYQREVPVPNSYEPEGRFGELAAELNCLVCHSIRGRGGSLAPDLTREGSRVQPEWLRRFLDRPDMIRPYLVERMPRFRLPRDEIEVIVSYIGQVLVDPGVPKEVLAEGEVTPALVERGRELYYSTYACDACHQIGLKGGALGPDLTTAAERLTEGWIYAWLRNSRQLDPNARGPVYEMLDEEARAITAFLLSLEGRELYGTEWPAAGRGHSSRPVLAAGGRFAGADRGRN